MHDRYYDPEIFVQTLDGIDRSSHIVATYVMDDELPDQDFVDHFALIQAMTLEGSTGTWEKVAEDTERSFHEVFFDENVTPSRLIGAFDPALVVRNGRNISSFEPGPLIRAMVEGGLFVAQELNRATEFCQNSLISPLEERHYHLFPLGMVKAHENFAFVATQNPIETAGTYRLSKVLVDRVGCWIRLGYPTRETEMEIIMENTPAFSLPTSALEKIYDIVDDTRQTASLEVPASPRSGIFLTMLVNRYLSRFEDEDAAIRFFAPAVLSKEMRVRDEGKTVSMVIDEIIERRLA